jgi:hypothetical protein
VFGTPTVSSLSTGSSPTVLDRVGRVRRAARMSWPWHSGWCDWRRGPRPVFGAPTASSVAAGGSPTAQRRAPVLPVVLMF